MTSTPPAWHWRDECYVPVPTPELPESATLSKQNDGDALSAGSCNLSDLATLGVQNDSNPDPTYQDCWPSERYKSDGPDDGDQCDECRSAPGQPHATGCDEVAKVTDSVINVESCPECGAVTDLDYGPESVLLPKRESGAVEETFSVPFPVQEFLFESLAEHALDDLHNLIDDHYGIILKMARARFHRGYVDHGSEMYSWSPERRFEETLQELADAVVYPTSGSIE